MWIPRTQVNAVAPANLVFVTGEFNFGDTFYQRGDFSQWFSVDPETASYGFRLHITSVPMLIGAGGNILSCATEGMLLIDHGLPLSWDAFDLAVAITASNQAGTEVAHLNENETVIPAGTPGGAYTFVGATYSSSVGTDIVMADDGIGEFTVKSTAGGIFSCAVMLSGGYD